MLPLAKLESPCPALEARQQRGFKKKKRQEAIFGRDGWVYHFDGADGFTGGDAQPNSSNRMN